MPRVEWSFLLPAEDHKEFKWFMAYHRSHLSPWGRIVFLILPFGLAISSVGTHIAAFYLPSFIIALLVTSYFLSLFFKPKVSAKRYLPAAVTAGAKFSYDVIVTNTSKRPIRNLYLHERSLPYGLYELPQHDEFKNTIDWLDPGESQKLTLAFRAPRRGIFELPVMVASSSFPSGVICKTARAGTKEKLVVYPVIKRDVQLPFHLRRLFQPGGLFFSSTVGDSNEFANTREYRHGDRLKDVHWPSTARMQKLIVREYVEEYFVRVGLFLDTELKKYEKHKFFEHRISLCAGIADQLFEQGYAIDQFISTERPQHCHVGHGAEPFHILMETLSAIEGDKQIDLDVSLAQIEEHMSNLSMLVVFLKDWDEERSAFVQHLKESGLEVHTVIVRNKPLTLDTKTDNLTVYTTRELERAND